VIDQHGRGLEPEDATPVTPVEEPVRPVGHEGRVRKFRDAVLVLNELLAEDDTTLILLSEDAIEQGWADGSFTEDHIVGLGLLLIRIGY
jgi:hypothetical protein